MRVSTLHSQAGRLAQRIIEVILFAFEKQQIINASNCSVNDLF
jgi:hypothetical protein